MPRTATLAAVAGSLIAFNWLRLEEHSNLAQTALIVALGVGPALAPAGRRRLAACVIAFLVAGGSALGLGPGLHYPGPPLSRFGLGVMA